MNGRDNRRIGTEVVWFDEPKNTGLDRTMNRAGIDPNFMFEKAVAGRPVPPIAELT